MVSQPPPALVELLRKRGRLTREQLSRLLTRAGHGDRLEALLIALDPNSTGSIDSNALLRWLYPDEASLVANPTEGSTSSPNKLLLPERVTQSNADAPTNAAEPPSPISPRSGAWNHKDVKRMQELMHEHTDLQDALVEYRQMARELAEDFLSRGKNPQAEAFIEQVCVEKILEGCIFVGHVKTDLDSVAGALGAAALWRGTAARAERELNGEIIYALKFAGLEKPPFFDDVPGAIVPDAAGVLHAVCLVDHNEEKQMVESLRRAPDRSKRICGLIDHHCLSESFSSEVPVFMDVRPWGSMSTIVAHSFIRSNRLMSQSIARILLCAILSDTLNLQSVTTTHADRMMVTLLSILGAVDDVDTLARGMFRAKTEWIVNLGAYEMTRGDQKDFSCNGWKLGIAVLEVTDPGPVLDVADQLLLELRILKLEKGEGKDGAPHDRRKELDFAFLFVVDVTAQRSFLLICGGRELALATKAFPNGYLRAAKPGVEAPGNFIKNEETLLDVGSLVSRKAQFVPSFFKALSAGFTCHKKPMSEFTEKVEMVPGEAEVIEAMLDMKHASYHDSVHVVRDYTQVNKAFERQKSLET